MIWLTGSNGMLGREIALQLTRNNIEFIGTDIEIDITDINALRKFILNKKLSWIINCVAYTAVDKAESEKEKVYAINAVGAGNLAVIANEYGAKIIHFSTDYVFDGLSQIPYKENTSTGPDSVYGASKLDGEKLVAAGNPKHFIFRISWLYGMHGGNFVKTMLRLFREKDKLNVVADQKGSPTYSGVLAENITTLVKSGSDKYGIYHYSDEEIISWHEFACAIQEMSIAYGFTHKKIEISAIPTSEYPTAAKRPAYSAMDKEKVKKELDFKVLHWKDNLTCFFGEMKNATV